MKYYLSAITILLLFSLPVKAQNPVRNLPDFVFFNKQNNQPFTKESVTQGKKSLFVFFDSDCEHCQHAALSLARHSKSLNHIRIYFVTLDDAEKIDHFMHTYCAGLANKPNVTVLMDRRNEFITKFNPRKYPSMMLFSVKGELLEYEDDEQRMNNLYNALNI